MDITKAFAELHKVADADPEQVKEGRRRRDMFRTGFCHEDDVDDVVPSGSLARSTQRDPINDVDVIIVYHQEHHPDWGQPGESAKDALNHTAGGVHRLLGSEGTVAQEVRLARPGNHAVKCFFDDPEDPAAFTVDAMPALRLTDGTLLVPEKESQKWIQTNPEYLFKLVADRHADWDLFRPMVRVLKLWKDEQDTSFKSLTVEVLAIHHMPGALSVPQALYRFFNAIEGKIGQPVLDPAGLCGPTQREIDWDKAGAAVRHAARASWEAVNAQNDGDSDRAACLWHSIFGDAFPEPPGGCDQAGGNGTGTLGAGLMIGVGSTTPRPVKDAPQG
jgi:hypothetical protein